MTTPPNPREALRAIADAAEQWRAGMVDDEQAMMLIAALAAQPPAVSVDEAMVDRALFAPLPDAKPYTVQSFIAMKSMANARSLMRAALTAALNPTQDAAHGGRDDG